MTTRADEVALYLKRRARWSPLEIAFWIFAFATIWLFPGKYLILKDTAILALFALICAGLVAAALGFVTSFLVLRGSDLTRLMVTLGVSLMLGELANRYSNITGGADGLQGVEIAPIFGLYRFDLFGHNGYVY